MRKTTVLLAILAVLFVGKVWAAGEFYNGNRLYADLSSGNHYARGYGQGYVIGVSQTYRQLAITGFLDRTFEIPVEVQVGQVIDIAQQYLKKHPEQRHLPAPALILSAIQGAFPLKDKLNPSGKPDPHK